MTLLDKIKSFGSKIVKPIEKSTFLSKIPKGFVYTRVGGKDAPYPKKPTSGQPQIRGHSFIDANGKPGWVSYK